MNKKESVAPAHKVIKLEVEKMLAQSLGVYEPGRGLRYGGVDENGLLEPE